MRQLGVAQRVAILAVEAVVLLVEGVAELLENDDAKAIEVDAACCNSPSAA